VESNVVFAQLPASSVAKLQAKHHFYIWDEYTHAPLKEIRIMTSFASREADVLEFVDDVKDSIQGC
jgi:threonine aldolase